MKANIHFLIISLLVILRMRNALDKIAEKIKTHISVKYFFFFRKSCRLWDNAAKYSRAGQATDENVVHVLACWIPKATNTHSEYAILVAFLEHQWLSEHTSLLHYSTLPILLGFRTDISVASALLGCGPWRWGQYGASKRRDPVTHWRSILSYHRGTKFSNKIFWNGGE